MKVPYSWLREHCDPGLPPEALGERLSMTGTEVERVGLAGAPRAEGYVVGSVLAADPHPNADRLRVCAVDVGEREPRTIVCGAPNVAAGQRVPVALPGAVLPDGRELDRAELRGVTSDGMILSEAELALGEDAAGIAVLDGGATGVGVEPGTPLAEVLPVSEPVLELEITPNRPDCLAIWGVAREVHAITGAPLGPEPWVDDAAAEGEGEVGELAAIRVEVPELCPRFTARAFTEVSIGPSPLWLKARLIAAGQRPINNVVDITNYVMLLTGQPLHAFDLDRVAGGELTVRAAEAGETMRTLDEVERTFDSDAVLICDRDGPTSIAGIMGGTRSEVSETTSRLLLEAASWDGPNILSTSGKLGLRSEASARFEKQLHPELAMRAQRIASRLLVELCGARLIPGTIDVDAGAERFSPRRVRLRSERVMGLLGMEIPSDSSAAYLEDLGFGVASAGGDLEVEVPPDRHFDVSREIDLIEEVARVHGLDEHLPTTLPDRGAVAGRLEPHQRLLRAVEDRLRDAGLDEIVSWSFVDPSHADRLGLAEAGRPAPIAITNPLSDTGSVMRTSLLGGLLDTAAYNLARGAERVALFESGRVYLPGVPPAGGAVPDGTFAGERPAPAHEPQRIGALFVGPLLPASWRQADPPPVDFYAAKGLLELVCGASGAELALEPAELPFLHPGRAAELLLAGEPGGWIGELHPRIAEGWDIEGGAAFELDFGRLWATASEGHEQYEDVASFPAVYEDIAVIVPGHVAAAEVLETVRSGGGELLRRIRVFDVYTGEQVGKGRRSLALRLEFRAPDRTLTDAEVAERRAAIVEAIEGIGGLLRG